MLTTVMLVEWAGGWTAITAEGAIPTFGVREASLNYTTQQSIEEVVRLAGAELSGMFAKTRQQMTVEHRPANLAETPYVGYIPSDRVTADDFEGDSTLFPVLSMAVTENDDGEVTFVPVLGDIIDGIEDLQDLIRMNAKPIRWEHRPESAPLISLAPVQPGKEWSPYK